MAILSAITLYPIKSCAGMALRTATLKRAGLTVGPVSDREWMVVDAAGYFLTQREHPRMALMGPARTRWTCCAATAPSLNWTARSASA
jgi:hypothetical protein